MIVWAAAAKNAQGDDQDDDSAAATAYSGTANGQKLEYASVPASGGYQVPGYSGITVYGDDNNRWAAKAIAEDVNSVTQAAGIVEKASEFGVSIITGSYQDLEHYQDGKRVIQWNPYASIVDMKGNSITPALALLGEIDHASIPISQWQSNVNSPSPVFGWKSLEEYRVHAVDEHAWAIQLGQGLRTNLEGEQRRVDSPFDRWRETIFR